MLHAWIISNIDGNKEIWDSITLSNSNLKFHTVVVVMLSMFDEVFTVIAISRVFRSLIHLSHLTFQNLYHSVSNQHCSRARFMWYYTWASVFCVSFVVFMIPILRLLLDAFRNSNLLNLRNLPLYHAQSIDTGAYFKHILDSSPDLNSI